ncbi:MAG: hypothetical protein ACYC3I_13880 [Gemmataceae bacterium]
MNQELLEMLKRSTPAEARARLNLSDRDLDAQVLQLTASLNGQIDSSVRQAILAYVDDRLRESDKEARDSAQRPKLLPELGELHEWLGRHYRMLQQQYHTPEVMEWARRTFNEEEFLAGLREIETTGGLQFEDFIHELEQEVKPRE